MLDGLFGTLTLSLDIQAPSQYTRIYGNDRASIQERRASKERSTGRGGEASKPIVRARVRETGARGQAGPQDGGDARPREHPMPIHQGPVDHDDRAEKKVL